MVLAALSVHSLLAGLALGAEASLASAWVLFFAIFAHKSTAGFALGVSLMRSHVSRGRSWMLLGFFALSTPIGILSGTGLDVFLEGSAERTAEASFLSLAAGTFVYVATFDFLRDEFEQPGGRLAKWGGGTGRFRRDGGGCHFSLAVGGIIGGAGATNAVFWGTGEVAEWLKALPC